MNTQRSLQRPLPSSFIPTQPQPELKKSGFFRRRATDETLVPDQLKRRKRRRVIGGTVLVLVLAAFGLAYNRYRTIRDTVITDHEGESSNVLNKDISSGKLNAALYTKPGDGRFNLVIIGVGGENHPGGNLTDTLQVMSIDTLNKKMSTTSIPRDLYVTMPTGGKSKVNGVYTAAEQKKKGSGPAAVRQMVGTILGTTVTNYVYIDFEGVKDIVDSLGGIDVTVEKDLVDPFFPCADMVKYCPFSIKAGPHHLDGTTALKYSRSRETTSDFDRSARQQIVMQAIKAKGMSAGVLGNPVKLNNLMTAISAHFKTDLSTTDIRSLLDIYTGITADNTEGYVLDTSSSLGLLTASSGTSAGYIAYPVLGEGRYDAVHEWFAKNNPDPLLTREAPTVTLFNAGNATDKQMKAMATRLTSYGYTVTTSATTLSKKYTTTQVFTKDAGDNKISANYLKNILGVDVQSGLVGKSSTDFEVVITSSSINLGVAPTPKASPKATASAKPSATPAATAAPTPSPTPETTPEVTELP